MQTSKQQIIQDFIREVKSFNRFNPEANYAQGLTERDVELVGLLNIVLSRNEVVYSQRPYDEAMLGI